MPSVHEIQSERFRRWELRGRGWQVFENPVAPEPPFLPFGVDQSPIVPRIDDGHHPTFLSSLVQRLSRKLSTEPVVLPIIPDTQEPEPIALSRDSIVELQTSLPAKLDVNAEVIAHLLHNIFLCREPISFELLGTAKRVSVQFATSVADAPVVRRQLQAHFPEVTFLPRESALQSAWDSCSGDESLVVEFGLEREFMLPLATGKLDPFIGIVGALSEFQPDELGLFQVLFQPVQAPWAESIVNSVSHADGKPFFVNQPELTGAAESKTAYPLYAVVVRIATKGETFDRVVEIARDLAGALRVFATPKGNALVPLSNEEYPFENHVEDVILRQTRRSGMILNSAELIGFVHLPSSAVRSPALERESGKTKAAPSIARNPIGVLLGNNVHAGQSLPVRLSPDQRMRHTHIIGSSGTGKSTLLFNMIREDIENGEGVAVLDPHGDLVEKILGIIPSHRIADVVLVDPSDTEYAIGFNILSAHTELEKTLLASDLVSVFQRLSTSWGDQMQSVLQNAILAFLESDRPGTLADLRRFLVEPDFRKEFLNSVHDTNVLYYWHKGFTHLGGNKSIGPILTRLEMFLSRKPILHMVSQPENRLDFGQIMDSGKIFLAKLPEGLLGKENSYLLGTLLISKFQQLAMSRQAKQIEARRDFWIYLDEFHNFITPSMAEILSGARKYRIGLTLAHHELRQLQRDAEVASAVMSHPCTRIVFRIGDDDARKLGEGFSFFESKDLQKLGTGEAIARVERSDFDFNLSIPLPAPLDKIASAKRRQQVITASREKYSTLRTQVETRLREAWENDQPASKATKAESIPPPVSKPPPIQPVIPISSPLQLPAVTASEKKKVVTLPPKPDVISEIQTSPAVAEPKPPRDLGKGGNQHQAIQRRIKEAAEALGFRSVIEHQFSKSQESVDLWLERDDEKFACEISITTTIDHEVGNVAKCVKAGFQKIVIICIEEGRLQKISAAVSGSLGAQATGRVSYYLPDQFIARLKTLPLPAPKLPTKIVRRGYKVKHSVKDIIPEEQREKEKLAIGIIAEMFRTKPPAK